MKLSISIIALAAMFAVAAASPMVDVSASRSLLTEAHAAAPGAGSSVSGARGTAPPARFMASAPEAGKGTYEPSQAGRLRDTSDFEKTTQKASAEEITDTLLYLTRPVGTTYTYTTPILPSNLDKVAEHLVTSEQHDPTAHNLGQKLRIIAQGFGKETEISPKTQEEFHGALRAYLEAHPNLNELYNARTLRRISEQEAMTGNAIGGLQSHVVQMDYQIHDFGEVLNAVYQALPKEAQEAVRTNIEQSRRHEAYLKQQELLRANNPKAFPVGRPQSSSPSPSGPVKESSHESLFTQAGANTGASDYKLHSTGNRENFRPSEQEPVTGNNAQRPVYSSNNNAKEQDLDGSEEGDDEEFYDSEPVKTHQVSTQQPSENLHDTQSKLNPILGPNTHKVLSQPTTPAAAKAAAAA
ncbi:hypothetical protein CROQUDRAFT_477610 [Cronartium quercuum f. sp. fusiforme G11]|uniref:Uncharacterized protein n=1 Tax=Cronartium quercuum f. sp. fusiforme G11 TaxID=708437 RepID=A0A9P6NI33_9BASI|nr:hypothetical protein CROQUDRAFT_477610 [Cronartium quercuum f. sp. fusiforme G11]